VIAARPSAIIRKSRSERHAPPNLADHTATAAAFSWAGARRELDGLPAGRGLNIAHEAVDRHARGVHGNAAALRCLGHDGSRESGREITYRELAELSNRFANSLASLGVAPGDTVFVLAPRVPEVYIAAIGAWKARAVFCPLFSAFGPEPILTRMTLGHARVLVTTTALYDRKVAKLRASLPELTAILLIDGDTGGSRGPGVYSLPALLETASAELTIPATAEDDPAVLHFTSGTTGTPKGAVHAHGAVLAHHVTGRLALDLHPGDVFWCTADPGWVTGTSYGIIAPLSNAVTVVVDAEDFEAERWYRILEQQRVAVWYTAPTAIRMLIKAGVELARRHRFPDLRFAASVGEPLDAEGVLWGQAALGIPFHDNWWQTETGGIMIANFASMDIKPGSMGKPIPGVEAAIVRVRTDGEVEPIETPDTTGELALRPGWPSMFRGYLDQEERYRKCFRSGWYLSGDLAQRDADGYYWFVGRADDVIKSAGHLVGPFEVESALLQHPAVAEAGVIGKPDATAGAVIKAFVSLRTGAEPSDALRRELLAHARRRRRAARDRVLAEPAENAIRQDHAAPAQSSRARAAARRHLHARKRRDGSHRMNGNAELTTERDRELLHAMLRIRRFEEKCVELYSASKIRGFLHLYIGQEAVAVGVMRALRAADAVVATYREHGHALARGISMGALFAEMYGKREGCCRGRGGSMHVFDAGTRFFGGNAIVGGGLPLAVGLALATKLAGKDDVTACFFGEGAVAEGAFHESLNLAALWRLPVLFVCENNLYAMGTALSRSESQTSLTAKAASYNLPAERVDGMDVLAVEKTAARVVAEIRAGGGPRFLELATYRFRAHSMFDPELYRDKAEVESWKQRGPIVTLTATLRAAGLLDDAGLAALEASVEREIAAALELAEAGTLEPVADLVRDVYARGGAGG
jgi:acetyl-CoA synthetase